MTRFVVACGFLLACGGNGIAANDAGPDDASANDSAQPDAQSDGSTPPSLIGGVQVLFPPSNSAAVKTYLMSNPAVAGAVINVDWSDFDLGGGTYDFTIPDASIAAWESAGKRVNLVLQNTPYGGNACPSTGSGSHGTSGIGNCSIPPWLWSALGASGHVMCTSPTGNQQAPNFRSATFVGAYQAAIAAFVAHYASHPAVGYIRVGLGKGGEINLPTGWDDTTTPCGQAFTTAWGYSVAKDASGSWNAYLQSMVEYEGGLHASKPLLVSITPVTNNNGVVANAVPDFLAPVAVASGVGFGNQGLQYSDTTSYPKCGGDWCNLFNTFVGQAPLELQTLGPSCPAGVGNCPGTDPTTKLANATGSLVPLVPFAVAHHVVTLELYAQDWLVAYDPTNADYAAHGADYRSAIEAAASAL